jgi:putative heme-binding domain-containing protein
MKTASLLISLPLLAAALPFTSVLAADRGAARTATPAESLKVLDGFKVELLRSAQPGEGSWVALTTDPKGRLILSPQGKEPMLRITLDGQGQIAKLENDAIPANVSGAMGLLYANNSLYVNGQGPDGYHMYRLTDTDGDDKFDKVELIRRWEGGTGEHGAHGIVLGPDKKLYVVCGNFVGVPRDLLPTSPHKNYADDLILPRAEDGNGFGAGKKPPGGYVVRMDLDGKNCELFASGQRNTYDIGFNTDGELFGFDSDMEWDWGMPWYRPIRAFHAVSGGDTGFREGSGKWPEYYADSLPAVVNIGVGSPTGVRFGTGARFPRKYQRAFYMMDWSYGRIIAVHLMPKGASYAGTFENLVVGKPLNVTDFEIGPDGALYFATGGRGTQSGLYRVSYTEKFSDEKTTTTAAEAQAAEARALRHKLETFHGHKDAAALDAAWPHLNSEDRFIRYAARIAIESQPVAEWKDRALSETNVTAALTAFLALARLGDNEAQRDLLKALARFPLDGLPEEQKLEKLRLIEVSFARHGKPDPELVRLAIEKLDRQYPAASWPLNRELSQLLIFLEAPGVVGKTLDLIDRAETQEEQIHYLAALRNLKPGWTLEQRRRYFSWFNGDRRILHHPPETLKWFADVGRDYSDGSSFPKFIANLRKAATAVLSDAERGELASVILGAPVAPRPPAVARRFVKEWKMDDLLPDLGNVSTGRSFENGRQAFNDAQCIACHRFGNEGGAVGPELTAASSKYTRRDILESILEPSKVVSEQYQNVALYLKNGEDISGRVMEEDNRKVVLVTDPLKQTQREVRKNEIQERRPSRLSPMPEGLVNILSREEILDLLAYIESGGRENAAAFGRK